MTSETKISTPNYNVFFGDRTVKVFNKKTGGTVQLELLDTTEKITIPSYCFYDYQGCYQLKDPKTKLKKVWSETYFRNIDLTLKISVICLNPSVILNTTEINDEVGYYFEFYDKVHTLYFTHIQNFAPTAWETDALIYRECSIDWKNFHYTNETIKNLNPIPQINISYGEEFPEPILTCVNFPYKHNDIITNIDGTKELILLSSANNKEKGIVDKIMFRVGFDPEEENFRNIFPIRCNIIREYTNLQNMKVLLSNTFQAKSTECPTFYDELIFTFEDDVLLVLFTKFAYLIIEKGKGFISGSQKYLGDGMRVPFLYLDGRWSYRAGEIDKTKAAKEDDLTLLLGSIALCKPKTLVLNNHVAWSWGTFEKIVLDTDKPNNILYKDEPIVMSKANNDLRFNTDPKFWYPKEDSVSIKTDFENEHQYGCCCCTCCYYP